MKSGFSGLALMLAVLMPAFMLTGVLTAEGNEADEAEDAELVSMSPEQVASFVKALPEFLKAFPEYSPMRQGLGAPVVSLENLPADQKLRKLNQFSVKNGYKDFEEFTSHFSGALTAYTYLKTLEAKEMFEAQVKSLPPVTAAIISAQMAPLLQSMEELKKSVSPKLVQALKPHMQEMDKIMGIKK